MFLKWAEMKAGHLLTNHDKEKEDSITLQIYTGGE